MTTAPGVAQLAPPMPPAAGVSGAEITEGLVFRAPEAFGGIARSTRRVGMLYLWVVAPLIVVAAAAAVFTSSSESAPWAAGLSACIVVAALAVGVSFEQHLQLARQIASANTVATARGLYLSGAKSEAPVPWPRSRSSFFLVARPHRGNTNILAYMVCADGERVSLPGVAQSGRRDSLPLLVARANAQLDALWAWGVAHGATQESGQYVPLRNAYLEKLRRGFSDTASL